MTRLADIEVRIASMDELGDIVGAMRSLAGMRMQEAQQALPGVLRYAGMVANAIASTLLLLENRKPATPVRAGRRGIILFTAEHGFVGGFNERMFDAAAAVLRPDDFVYVLGSRGAAVAVERGRAPDWMHAMPTRCAAATDMVHELSGKLYQQIGLAEITRIEMLYTRSHQGSAPKVERRLLLPLEPGRINPAKLRLPPLHNLDPARLYEKLVAEYVFAVLTETAVESIVSENAARFAAMEAAHTNVARRLDGLRVDASQMRQSEITAEICELATAAQALSQAG